MLAKLSFRTRIRLAYHSLFHGRVGVVTSVVNGGAWMQCGCGRFVECFSRLPSRTEELQIDESVQALLPLGRIKPTLKDMAVGEVRYTTPWGMWVNSALHCFLHPDYTADPAPHGTVEMRVERPEDGFHVYPPFGWKYTPRRSPGYMSHPETQYIPIRQVYDGPLLTK